LPEVLKVFLETDRSWVQLFTRVALSVAGGGVLSADRRVMQG